MKMAPLSIQQTPFFPAKAGIHGGDWVPAFAGTIGEGECDA